MAKIYYLNWDNEHREKQEKEPGPASKLFHDLHIEEPPDTIEKGEFNRLYRKIRELNYDLDDPENLWKQWNRGSGYESQDFLSTRYCRECEDSFESLDDAYVHFYHQHLGADTELNEFFEYVQGIRSMSVGDIVEIDDTYYMAASLGWKEIEIQGQSGDSQ